MRSGSCEEPETVPQMADGSPVTLGRLVHQSVRSVWKDEARDFTPWLAENLPALSEALGFDLELTAREAEVGDFSVDLLAKDLTSGHPVVIENQFGTSNHDHFGKVLTYASGFDATAVVWLAERFREEHRQALDWLNQRTDSETSFFGVLIEVFRIDNSPPAVSLQPVVFPNKWQKEQRRSVDRRASPRAERYRVFFQSLIDELRQKHRFTNARVGQPQNWYSFSTGVSGFQYSFSFAQGRRLRAEIYIDRGEGAENARALSWLERQKETIERDFGAKLEWETLEGKRACRVGSYRPGSIDDEERLDEYRMWAVESLLKLKRILGPRLQEYEKEADRGRVDT